MSDRCVDHCACKPRWEAAYADAYAEAAALRTALAVATEALEDVVAEDYLIEADNSAVKIANAALARIAELAKPT